MPTATPATLAKAIAVDSTSKVLPPVDAPAEVGRMSQAQGFPPETQQPLAAGGVPPWRDDMNGALNLLSQHTLFAQSGNAYPWIGPPAVYNIGSRVLRADRAVVVSTVDANVDSPNVNMRGWRFELAGAPEMIAGTSTDQLVTPAAAAAWPLTDPQALVWQAEARPLRFGSYGLGAPIPLNNANDVRLVAAEYEAVAPFSNTPTGNPCSISQRMSQGWLLQTATLPNLYTSYTRQFNPTIADWSPWVLQTDARPQPVSDLRFLADNWAAPLGARFQRVANWVTLTGHVQCSGGIGDGQGVGVAPEGMTPSLGPAHFTATMLGSNGVTGVASLAIFQTGTLVFNRSLTNNGTPTYPIGFTFSLTYPTA